MDAQTGCLGIVLALMLAVGAFFVVGSADESVGPTPAPMLIETPAPTP